MGIIYLVIKNLLTAKCQQNFDKIASKIYIKMYQYVHKNLEQTTICRLFVALFINLMEESHHHFLVALLKTMMIAMMMETENCSHYLSAVARDNFLQLTR